MRRKVDSDLVLSQALIWLLLIAYVVLIYAVVISVASAPFGETGVDYAPPYWHNILALVLIALTVSPVYRWLRSRVRELIYGQHDMVYPTLAQINHRLDSTPSPKAILPAIAATIANTLKLPFVEIEAQSVDRKTENTPLVTTYGIQPKGASIETVPLTYYHTTVGELRVAGRHWDEPLSGSDLTVLNDLARQVGIALYAAQLTADLQVARERLVIAREEERRRIRNDLHDGLAPTISSLQLQLGAVRNLLRVNPEQAEHLINDLGADLHLAAAEIRQLVYDLRPPMLDDLGLVAALRHLGFPGSSVSIEVSAPEVMPPMSAAVEVAVYRIASEAIHNVVKHSQAKNCMVRLEVTDSQLIVSVTDDGIGLPSVYQSGIGSVSMRERAEEIGGVLSIQTCENHGTCVEAIFPNS